MRVVAMRRPGAMIPEAGIVEEIGGRRKEREKKRESGRVGERVCMCE